MSDAVDSPNGPATGSFPGEMEAAARIPRTIGRYAVVGVLGQGGFGVVYLGQDEQLGRLVAIKVPHARQIANPGDAETYLREARTVAGLDHPHIVPVYDVGSTPECPFFVVSKHIDGSTLAERLRISRYSATAAADLVATMAECLHYAHRKGLVHRDVKPGNILIDSSDRPFLTDFGLALLEQDNVNEGGFCGTPAYMSPEQARGEGHRVDGRSDVFSLGIIFYELLAGRRPFQGEAGSVVADQIVNDEPKPPRQIADNIPRELERICLTALSKRATDRYTTARDFAEDLRHFLRSETRFTLEPNAPADFDASAGILANDPDRLNRPPILSTLSAHPALRIVPKGLRSFDENDADFFLELLPGPRDRNGLPENIRFWKARIEGIAPENTFTVGLIYGPSGCGKSSLLKAGLLPRLSDCITPIYVEATPEDTEQRLLRCLRKSVPGLPDQSTLTESLAALRRGGLAPGKKVLIVIDQFEQWLHSWKDSGAELVQALRQCDGEHVQCLVLVRDDFYAAVNRFFQKLEVPIQEGRNFVLVDLFDVTHAQRLLTAFGRAYGRLPQPPAPLTTADRAFLSRAVEGLSQDGRVISIRLALFAEMMKSRAWTAATLSEVGGTEGVGVTFLEETFSSQTASPAHRVHQVAARAVLQALLPAAGTDIKGQMKRADELLAVSGYQDRPDDFRTLLTILESEVRIIAPTEPGEQSLSEAPTADPNAAKYYQLTHDFLVPAVRAWLTRKQLGTPEGRAQLLLAERASLWTRKPEVKQLPSGLEWLTIIARTRRARWSEAERRVMAAATRRHAMHLAIGVTTIAVAMVLAFGLREQWRRYRDHELADQLVNQVLVADVSRVADVATQLEDLPGDWRLRLESVANDRSGRDGERLRAQLALARDNPDSVPFLIAHLTTATPGEFAAIQKAIAPRAAQCRDVLWEIATNDAAPADRRFHAAVALAEFDPTSENWKKIAGPTAAALVRLNPLVAPEWTRLLRPARKQVLHALVAEYMADPPHESQRTLAAGILADYAADEPDILAEAIQETTDSQFQILFPAVKANADRSAAVLQKSLAGPAPTAGRDIRARTRRRANAATALFLLDRPEAVRTWLGQSGDPDLRTALIDLLPTSIEFDALWPLSRPPSNELTRQAVLLSVDVYRTSGRISPDAQRRLESELTDLFVRDESAAVHSAAEWLLRRLGRTSPLDKLTADLAGRPRPKWWVTPTGHTMVLVRGPAELQVGAESGPPLDGGGRKLRIEKSYAIATHEVTAEQFLKFFPNHPYAKDVTPTPDCPISGVSWFDAARYCRKLSEAERVPETEMVYPATDGTLRESYYPNPNRHLELPADWRLRSGYRLPTEAEWEFACRAGTTTPRFYGTSDDALSQYGRWMGNSDRRLWSVGSLRPNPFGLFDVLGNVGEWCADGGGSNAKPLVVPWSRRQVFRGGYFKQPAQDLRSDQRSAPDNGWGFSYNGFRIVRTVRLDAP